MSAVKWLGDDVGALGVTVNAKQYPSSLTCYDACWHKCNQLLNVSPFPGAPAGPPLLVEICASYCYDDSGCATPKTPVIDWTDPETFPQSFPDALPVPKSPTPAVPSPSPSPTPKPSQSSSSLPSTKKPSTSPTPKQPTPTSPTSAPRARSSSGLLVAALVVAAVVGVAAISGAA